MANNINMPQGLDSTQFQNTALSNIPTATSLQGQLDQPTIDMLQAITTVANKGGLNGNTATQMFMNLLGSNPARTEQEYQKTQATNNLGLSNQLQQNYLSLADQYGKQGNTFMQKYNQNAAMPKQVTNALNDTSGLVNKTPTSNEQILSLLKSLLSGSTYQGKDLGGVISSLSESYAKPYANGVSMTDPNQNIIDYIVKAMQYGTGSEYGLGMSPEQKQLISSSNLTNIAGNPYGNQ